MLIYNTKSAAEKIVKNSSKDNFSEVVDEIARGNTLLIFITDEKGNVLYISDEYKNAHKHGENIVINGSSGRLERAVYNLIDNAVRYTGDSKKIRVTLEKEGGKAVLRIIDFGKGISDEELSAIWDRYYTSRRRGGKGASGLGLAIVKQITALHGGRCYAMSKQSEGSVFVIELETE